MCITAVFLKESDTSLWWSRRNWIFYWKANFNSKTKTSHGVNTMHVNMSFATPQSNSSAVLFKRNGTSKTSHRRQEGPPVIVITWHFRPPDAPQEFLKLWILSLRHAVPLTHIRIQPSLLREESGSQREHGGYLFLKLSLKCYETL